MSSKEQGARQRSQRDTDRDLQELEQLRLTIDRFRAIVGASDDAIISKDLDGIVTSWNPGAERIFGWTEEEMIGRSVRVLILRSCRRRRRISLHG
jgi:PAS domain-containing protein